MPMSLSFGFEFSSLSVSNGTVGPGGNGGLLLESSGYLLLEDGSFLLLE